MQASDGAMDDAVYERFDTREGFQAAVDRLLDQPGRELRIFDRDGAALLLNDPVRIGRIERFLQASRTRRIYIVLHDPQHVQRQCPRMMSLVARYSHAIQIHCTQDEIRELQDSFMVLDSAHYLRRPVAAFFRGAISLADENEALAMRGRFAEIWAASYPAVSGTTIGL
jgi:hypothetical protein